MSAYSACTSCVSGHENFAHSWAGEKITHLGEAPNTVQNISILAQTSDSKRKKEKFLPVKLILVGWQEGPHL